MNDLTDLLEKCYYFLSLVRDYKITPEQIKQVGVLCDLIEEQNKE